jgi:ribonuclease BN (tRNA processing enzyme)
VRLSVVGAGPAYSDRIGAVGACYLLEVPGASMALDLGHGAFAGLAARVAPEALSTVFISHLHPDHFIDLVPLRHWLRYHAEPRARVRVDGPAALGQRIDALHGEAGFAAAALDFVPLAPGARTAGPFTLEVARVRHTDDSFAVRVSTGDDRPGLVYSGDIGGTDGLEPILRAGDALLIEVSFGPGPVPPGVPHLDGPAVGRLAGSRGAARVLLTHLLPGRDPEATIATVRESFDGPVELVAPGTVVDI